jgi:hypothetical protein
MKKPVGHPPNPPDYKTLQVRGVPPALYEQLQKHCREQIEQYKRIKKSVKV